MEGKKMEEFVMQWVPYVFDLETGEVNIVLTFVLYALAGACLAAIVQIFRG